MIKKYIFTAILILSPLFACLNEEAKEDYAKASPQKNMSMLEYVKDLKGRIMTEEKETKKHLLNILGVTVATRTNKDISKKDEKAFWSLISDVYSSFKKTPADISTHLLVVGLSIDLSAQKEEIQKQFKALSTIAYLKVTDNPTKEDKENIDVMTPLLFMPWAHKGDLFKDMACRFESKNQKEDSTEPFFPKFVGIIIRAYAGKGTDFSKSGKFINQMYQIPITIKDENTLNFFRFWCLSTTPLNKRDMYIEQIKELVKDIPQNKETNDRNRRLAITAMNFIPIEKRDLYVTQFKKLTKMIKGDDLTWFFDKILYKDDCGDIVSLLDQINKKTKEDMDATTYRPIIISVKNSFLFQKTAY